MTIVPEESMQATVAELAARGRAASRQLAKLSNEARNEALDGVARAIEAGTSRVLEANEIDCRAAETYVNTGKMSASMFARLRLSERAIRDMATKARNVAQLPDPLHRRLSATELDSGLVLYKESCPLGVVGVVFESRPDVIPQVASLTLKSGNAVLLKGGAEAAHTNEVLVEIWRETLLRCPLVPSDSIALLHTRGDVMDLLTLDRDVDLILPRGSQAFVRFVAQNSRVPVLGHGEGICHVYIDRAADLEKALRIVVDSKTQYPAACNAAETVLIHKDIAGNFLPPIAARLNAACVEIRGCPATVALLEGMGVLPATDDDWATEYSGLIVSVKLVTDVGEAIAHIDRYGSRHTETIVTEDGEAASRFMDEVDASGVYLNASTRFADGFRYGLGAEIGISTSKLHARGPVGLDGLTTYKYKLFGNGHIVEEYSSGDRTFKHRRLH